MNKLREKLRKHSRLTWRLLAGYIFALVGYTAALLLFVLLAWNFFNSIPWYRNELIYIVLNFVADNLAIFIGLALVLGAGVISYFFLSIPLGYLDQVVAASKQLAGSLETPIALSPAIRDVQDELNLVRERAYRAAAAAREAEQRKNDLIVYLAHDLKTPLTSVIGYLTLLSEEQEISPALRERYTGVALAKAERLEELINEFFDITRFNRTDIGLEREMLSLTRLLEQTACEFEPALQEKKLRWKLDLEPELCLPGDGDKLARVFDNLCRNAVGYSYPETEIQLSLRKEGGCAVVTVRNSGHTIPPEKLERLFEQFFRLDSSRATATGGAGLGLAIAKEIVEAHGGSIRAESADEYIVFTVTLPL